MSNGPWRHNRIALNLAFTGDSIVDFPKLDIQNRNEAKTFLTAYGYDAEDPIIREEIWRIYFEALHFIRNVLLDPHEVFPTAFYERNNQNDAIRLLMDASSPIRSERATWSCTILRVMHSISHLDNDLRLENFNYAREKIFSKFDPFVREVGPRRWVFGRPDEEGIPLLRYQKKVKKERNSMILKLI